MSKRFQSLGESDNFLGIPLIEEWGDAEVIILPLPLEMTTTYLAGTCKGPGALLEASHQVELFDTELKTEPYKRGIITLEPMNWSGSNPEQAVRVIEDVVFSILESGKKLVLLGGEHTVTVGAVRAFHRTDPGFSVLHLDAHADLRESYMDSRYNHACVLARILESCPAVSVGIRSMSKKEFDRIEEEHLPVYTMHMMRNQRKWMEGVVSQLTDRVYITLDLDVFDPATLPGVGTPEPGGMGWEEVLRFLRFVFQSKQVIGFDVVELSPQFDSDWSAFIAAKLVYRLIGYWITER